MKTAYFKTHFNPFMTNVLIAYPLKTPGNLYGVFKRYELSSLTANGSKILILADQELCDMPLQLI